MTETFPTAKSFIKCGSPLGEYELHCNQEQMETLLSEYEIVERLKAKIDDVKRALEHLEKNYPNEREEQKQIDWILLKNLKSILENKHDTE